MDHLGAWLSDCLSLRPGYTSYELYDRNHPTSTCLSFPICTVGIIDRCRDLGCTIAVSQGSCALPILQTEQNFLSTENKVQRLLRSHRYETAVLGLEPKSGSAPEPTQTPVGSTYCRVLVLVRMGGPQRVYIILGFHYNVSSSKRFKK